MPVMTLNVDFYFFRRTILNDFNIVLISSTEGVICQMVAVFDVGVELISGVKDVVVEHGAVDFFPMFIGFDMLNI